MMHVAGVFPYCNKVYLRGDDVPHHVSDVEQAQAKWRCAHRNHSNGGLPESP